MSFSFHSQNYENEKNKKQIKCRLVGVISRHFLHIFYIIGLSVGHVVVVLRLLWARHAAAAAQHHRAAGAPRQGVRPGAGAGPRLY